MNIIKKIYPTINNDKLNELKYDEEGLYSITLPEEANIISLLIIKNFKKKVNKCSIMDGTAGLGGNTLSFSNYFKNVVSYEINKSRYIILCKNIELYKCSNVKLFNKCSIDNLETKYDIYFFDPPWGGPEYKKEKKISLTISNKNLKDIVTRIFNIHNDVMICFKLPYNYNFNEFNNMKYYKKNIKNMIIILIYSIIK